MRVPVYLLSGYQRRREPSRVCVHPHPQRKNARTDQGRMMMQPLVCLFVCLLVFACFIQTHTMWRPRCTLRRKEWAWVSNRQRTAVGCTTAVHPATVALGDGFPAKHSSGAHMSGWFVKDTRRTKEAMWQARPKQVIAGEKKRSNVQKSGGIESPLKKVGKKTATVLRLY